MILKGIGTHILTWSHQKLTNCVVSNLKKSIYEKNYFNSL